MTKYKSTIMSVITSEEPSSSSASSSSGSQSSNEEEEQDSRQLYKLKPICGDCGKELDTGWNCSSCRRQCSICNRALSTNPDEFCERCYRLCQKHGLHSKIDGCFQCKDNKI